MISAGRWVLRGVNVIEPRDGSCLRDAEVLIEGERIRAVAPVGSIEASEVVSVPGHYLVPGFNDMHAHPLELPDPSGSLELMLAYGVTGYRQMSGSTALLRRRAADTLPDHHPGPALLAMPGALLTPLNAGTSAAARATVREQVAEGADFIKVGSVAVDVFFDAQAEAARLGVPICGHLPAGIDVERASRAGLASIEHLGPRIGLLAPCSHHEQHLQSVVRASRPRRLPHLGFLCSTECWARFWAVCCAPW